MVEEIHVVDLLPAYSLNCLDEEESAHVSRHLAVCAQCSLELIAYQQVSNALALAAPQVEPPARLKSALIEKIQSLPKRNQEAEKRSSWCLELLTAFKQFSPALSLASLTLVVLLGTSTLFLWGQIQDLRASQQQTQLRVISLKGTEFVPGATGVIVVSTDGMHGTLVVDKLPVLGGEQQYQLWLIQDGERTSGGLFSIQNDGYGSVWVEAPRPLIAYTSFGVTIEPAGGSSRPTGDKVLGGDL